MCWEALSKISRFKLYSSSSSSSCFSSSSSSSSSSPAFDEILLFLFVGCLKSQQLTGVFQGQICSDSCRSCHNEIEIADQAGYLTQSQCTDTGPASPSTAPIILGTWQDSHWNAGFYITCMVRPGKRPLAKREWNPRLPLSGQAPCDYAQGAV